MTQLGIHAPPPVVDPPREKPRGGTTSEVAALAESPLRAFIEAPPRVPEAAREQMDALRAALNDCGLADPTLPPFAEIARVRQFYEPILLDRYSSGPARVQDIEQLEHVAGTYSSRSRF